MPEIKIYEVGKSPVKMSKIEWRQLICTERGVIYKLEWMWLEIGYDKI